MNRNLYFCRLAAATMSALEGSRLHVENTENFPEGSAIYAVKHQSFRDMWCMGVALYRYKNAFAYYPMKQALPDALRLVGGIKIYRGEDIKRLLSKAKDLDAQAVLKRELRTKTAQTFRTLSEILASNTPNSSIIICPEGHRYRNGVGPLRRTGINQLLAAQTESFNVPLVPIGTEYKGLDAYLRIGKPRTYNTFNEENAREFRNELAMLSNCNVLDETISQIEKVRAL